MSHPVVMIHGMWCTGTNWERFATGLRARGFHCLAPDLPAHEVDVEHPEVGGMSLEDYVDYLRAYIAEQKFELPPILIGHSMGGFLAQRLASELETHALVLLTPAAPAGINALHPANIAAFWPTIFRWGFWNRPHRLNAGRAARYASNGLSLENQRRIFAGLVAESGRALFELGYWFLDGGRASRVQSGKVVCPVYVVSAGRDRLTPASIVRKVAKLYPGASLRHYPERSHWVLDDEETDDMVGEIAGWLLPLRHRGRRR